MAVDPSSFTISCDVRLTPWCQVSRVFTAPTRTQAADMARMRGWKTAKPLRDGDLGDVCPNCKEKLDQT